MHGIDPHDEIAYWRGQARHARDWRAWADGICLAHRIACGPVVGDEAVRSMIGQRVDGATEQFTYWRDQARHWQAKAEQLDAEVLKANESAQRIHNLLSSLCVSHAPSAEHQIDERIRGLAWARDNLQKLLNEARAELRESKQIQTNEQALIDDLRNNIANERQVVADLREQMGLVRRYIDEIEHDVLVTVQYRKARDSGGQHVGTGGKLGGAMPSTLVYLERLVRDLKGALDGAKR